MEEKLLYHYTSIETLALILSSKSICFNNLLNVDDIEESNTNDMGLFGKYINISCWTDDSEESIPLWNLYTPNMHGVRIGLPKFPFKKYHFTKGQYELGEDVDTYINLAKIYEDNKASIVSQMPEFCKIEYTDDNEKLYPTIRACNNLQALKKFIETGEKINDNLEVKYSFGPLGKCKRTNWTFQKEVRYIINCAPTPIKEFSQNPTFEIHREFCRRVEDKEYPAPYEHILLELDEECFKSLEILIGPKATDAEKIIVKSLVNQYCAKYKNPKEIVKESHLKINKNK
ncbi:DUF2971 domain-containing protein [Clostridium sp. M14]|uniref:DUF2971 domain-containing protein n=1 Tax=Clostridium sp. M14 TaxID=2716311 RepID=UPI0013EE7D9D|nr:DUF2971 domain-containing protein [Clostridium sp. M14]MBZ9692419.1 DUF2971 domain-containing protein [Clostridium sp. M14]